MSSTALSQPALAPARSNSQAVSFLVILAFAAALAWLTANFPASLPVWAPWEFSWPEFLVPALVLWWYVRGLTLTEQADRPAIARIVSFTTGIVLIYGVLQTHFDYMAQHMFFLNRVQHLVMHHLGPFLIALGWPGAVIARGMPDRLRRLVTHRAVRCVIRVLQHPIIAGGSFVALIDFWLIPAVHFQAMIDHHLYDIMNWSMVLDGLLFWCLVLDPRPSPPARYSFPVRMVTVIAVMFPQIMFGAYITFTRTDLFKFYDLCGRLFPSMTALNDQHIGGIIIWIPAAMMSSVAFMLILNNIRLLEEKRPVSEMTEAEQRMAALASRWTGR
jgi:putative membrane protein